MSWQAASVNNNAILKGNDTAMQSNERKQFLSLFSNLLIDWTQNHRVKNTGSGLSPRGAGMRLYNAVVLLSWLTKNA